MVVIHHYGGKIFPFHLSGNIFHSGNLAVSYFFVLSGFVLYVAHMNKQINYLDYLKRRFARIAPLYYVALFLTIGAIYFSEGFASNINMQILSSLLMIQAYLPEYVLTLNSPGWSISVEMLFYLSFPLLFVLQKRNLRVFIGLCVLLFLLSQYLHLHSFEKRAQLPDSIIYPLFFNPLIHLSQFMIGMVGGWWYSRTQDKGSVKWYMSLFWLVVMISLIALRPETISYHVGLIAPVFAMLIIAIARGNSKVLNWRGFIFLGEISYGVYILQYPVFKWLQMADARYLNLQPDLFFYIATLLLILIAAVMHLAIERPIHSLVHGRK